MATDITDRISEADYPTGDGKPMAETPIHRQNLTDLIAMLQDWYRDDPNVYVSGNMLLYYIPGDKRRHVSPDVFVTLGIPRLPERKAYFTWKEGKGPDLVIELTSPSTRHEDLKKKYRLYQDTLKVREYFLFDPFEQYLQPSLQGFRRDDRSGLYEPIKAVKNRIPSKVTGLHLERDGTRLRLVEPATGQWLPTPEEKAIQAEVERNRAELRTKEAEAERDSALKALHEESALRRQMEEELRELRRQLKHKGDNHST